MDNASPADDIFTKSKLYQTIVIHSSTKTLKHIQGKRTVSSLRYTSFIKYHIAFQTHQRITGALHQDAEVAQEGKEHCVGSRNHNDSNDISY